MNRFKMILRFLSASFFIVPVILYANEVAPSAEFTQQQEQARVLINDNKGEEALKILNELVKKYPSFQVYVSIAQANAEIEKPTEALAAYKQALEIAGPDNIIYRRIALFGIARIQLWLGHDVEAKEIYQELLKTELSEEDKKIALAGLAKATGKHVSENIAPATTATSSTAPASAPTATVENKSVAPEQTPTTATTPAATTPTAAEQTSTVVKTPVAPEQTPTTAVTPAVPEQTSTATTTPAPEQTSTATTTPPAQKTEAEIEYDKAVEFINKDKGAEALKILDELVKNQQTFKIYIALAQATAEIDKPEKALEYYQHALEKAGSDKSEQRVALFGVAKMQLWLEHYSQAKEIYEELLKDQLNEEDKKIALAGLEKTKVALAPAKKKIVRSPYWMAYDQAVEFINKDKGAAALKILAKLNQQEPNFLVYIAAAKACAALDKPEQALDYYEYALDIAETEDQINTALFGIAKTQAWRGNYADSKAVYGFLTDKNLDAADHEAALAGLVSAYANTDHPRKAYELIPPDFNYTQGDMVLNSAQASTWSGWSPITKIMLEQNEKVIEGVDKNSILARNLRNMKRQVAEETAINSFNPRIYGDHDNEGFYIQKIGARFAHRFRNDYNENILSAITIVNIDSLVYSQAGGFGIGAGRVDGVGYYLEQRFDTMQSYYVGRIGGESLGNWNPFLWMVKAGYVPNDYLRIQISNTQEVVESFLSIQNKITDNSTELQFSVNPFYRLRYDGSIYYQPFTDGNKRKGFYSSLDYVLFSDLSLLVETRVRGFRDTMPGSRFYYDPTSFVEITYLLKFQRHSPNNWFYHFDAGVGQQNVNAGGAQPISYYEAGLTALLYKNVTLDIFAGYTTSTFGSQNATVFSTGKYIRRFGGIQFNVFG